VGEEWRDTMIETLEAVKNYVAAVLEFQKQLNAVEYIWMPELETSIDDTEWKTFLNSLEPLTDAQSELSEAHDVLFNLEPKHHNLRNALLEAVSFANERGETL
jgi:hypothetical protein